MSGLIKIEWQGGKTIKDIQKRFEKELSEKVILQATAKALNDTASRVQGYIRKEVKNSYTLSQKYLDRASKTSKKAYSNTSGLYAEVSYSAKTIPLIGFKNNAQVGKRKPISVMVLKGKTTVFKHAFAATFKSGHTGIMQRGRYMNGHFVPERAKTASGRVRITELKAPSPFGMAFSERMKPRITKYVDGYLPGRVQFFLEQQLKRITK
jgi:hypothetical protein